MKRISYLVLMGLFLIIMNSCDKNSDSVTVETKSISISLGAGYANDIYYRLSDGLVTPVSRNNWDIAFSVSAREAAIRANTTSTPDNVVLKAYPVSGSDWSTPVDITGFETWTTLYNSDTTWTEGAFNMNATGHPNYGWGVYNESTHNLTGVSLYIILTRAKSYKKIWIENKLSADQKYTFKYADIDGSNEQNVILDLKGSNKNFVYYSLDTNEEVDREPDADMWDMVFTKYNTIIESINYTVTGVLQNTEVTAQESTDTDTMSEVFPTTGFLTNISTIGSDWKIINMETFQYTIDETRVFYVKDLNEAVYRIKFKTFEGSSTGNITFDISTLQ